MDTSAGWVSFDRLDTFGRSKVLSASFNVYNVENGLILFAVVDLKQIRRTHRVLETTKIIMDLQANDPANMASSICKVFVQDII